METLPTQLGHDSDKVDGIIELIRLEQRLSLQDNSKGTKARHKWKKVKILTGHRRKAIIRCFMAVPFYKLDMHRAVNIFLHSYQKVGLEGIQKGSQQTLREILKHSGGKEQPLKQLISMFTKEAVNGVVPVTLYSNYVQVLSMFCNVFTDEDDMDEEEDPTKNYKKFAALRARLCENQSSLSASGAAVMILQVLAICNRQSELLAAMSLHLGIALLKGGSEERQRELLKKLKGMDVEVLRCIEQMIYNCR